MKCIPFFILFSFLISCTKEQDGSKDSLLFNVPVVQLSDSTYPDNPAIGFRSEAYGSIDHSELLIDQRDQFIFDFTILPGNDISDTIFLKHVDIRVYLPDLPDWIKKDEYFTHIGVINQEWNRHQVRYDSGKDYWQVKGAGYDADNLVRLDLARNCLQSGLWELILFEDDETGGQQQYYHGWFTFPLDLYQDLFEEYTGLAFRDYEAHLLDWKDPLSEAVDLNQIRSVTNRSLVEWASRNDSLYPLTGARVKKRKNIVYPKEFTTINDLLNDSTVFATFSPPGFYNTKDPRQTKLSVFRKPELMEAFEIKVNGLQRDTSLSEIQLHFGQSAHGQYKLIFGGIDLQSVPTLSLEEHNKGLKLPMGFANHAFYETYERAQQNPANRNPYYGLILDEHGKWIDSHAVGIDGPLLFWDDQKQLHLMILSFERHAFVGHYVIKGL